MGYTHYWELNKEIKELPRACIEEIQKVIKDHSNIIQFEEDTVKDPIVTKNLIRFNGINEEAHETFYFDCPVTVPDYQKEKKFIFAFCKTARKKYDIVVCKVLLILKAYLQDNLEISSDGFSNDEKSFDGVWDSAMMDLIRSGYKIKSKVKLRENTLYYDCEILEIKPKI